MEEQYTSMKRVLIESQKLLELSRQSDEGWKTIDIDEKCKMAVRSNKTLMELKSQGVLDINIKSMLVVPYLMKLYT